MSWFTAHQRDNRTGLHKGCSSSPGLMRSGSVLVFYECYTCYKENWGAFFKDRRWPLFPTVISMAGVALCYSGDTLIKQEIYFPLGGKGQSHPVASPGCSTAWCLGRNVSCSQVGSVLSWSSSKWSSALFAVSFWNAGLRPLSNVLSDFCCASEEQHCSK